MALTDALNLGMQPPGMRPPPAAPTGPGAEFDVRAEQARQRMQPVQQQISQALQEKQKLAQEGTQFQAQQTAREAAGQAGIERGFQQQMEQAPMRPMLEEKVQQEKDYFFKPSQQDGMMMAGLASLITVLGTALGKGGKGYATAALAGMNGMMEGYQKGRDDVFKQERQAFETNAKALRDQITTIRTALQDYEKKAVTDRQRALAELKEKLTKEGADFLAARAERQGVANMLPELQRQEKQLQAQIDKYDTKAADARSKAEADALKAQRAKELAEMRSADAAARNAMMMGVAQMKENSRMALEELKREAPARRKADAYGFGEIVVTAANEAAASISNLVTMPSQVTAGLFGGRETKSLMGAPLDALINTTLTREDTQRYNTEINNLGKFIAQVQKGGRVVTNADIESTGQAFKIKEGDKPLTKLTKLAQARQALERALDVRIASPNTPDELKDILRQNKQDIERAIPFKVSDVNAYANQRDKKETFTQFFQKHGFGKTEEAPTPTPEAESKPTPAAKQKARPGEVVHQDAKGNKAVKRDGQWVEVE